MIKVKEKIVTFKQLKVGDSFKSKTSRDEVNLGDRIWMKIPQCSAYNWILSSRDTSKMAIINSVMFDGNIGYTHEDEVVTPVNLELVEV